MRILVVGAGVIGTVYGAQLAAAGHAVSILAMVSGRTRSWIQVCARHVVDVLTDSSAAVLTRSAGFASGRQTQRPG
jgi:ketopantoate reductase